MSCFHCPKSAKLPKKYCTLSRKVFLSFILYRIRRVILVPRYGDSSYSWHLWRWLCFIGGVLSCLSKEEEDGEEKSEVSLCRRVINMAHTPPPPPFPPPKITCKKGDADAGGKKGAMG